MAYPGTYNISYYKGDTLEFRIFPKDASGAAFDLEDYYALFSISTARGAAGEANKISSADEYDDVPYIEIDETNNSILCVITPEAGERLTAGTTYVYDVQISKEALPYNIVNTLLTGSITVQDQVGTDNYVGDLGGS